MPDEHPAGEGERSGGTGAAAVFLVLGVFLVAAGFFVMFAYNEQPEYSLNPGMGQIVGGDAYNYIIIATRGVGFICAGGVSSLLGVSLLLVSVLRELQLRPSA